MTPRYATIAIALIAIPLAVRALLTGPFRLSSGWLPLPLAVAVIACEPPLSSDARRRRLELLVAGDRRTAFDASSIGVACVTFMTALPFFGALTSDMLIYAIDTDAMRVPVVVMDVVVAAAAAVAMGSIAQGICATYTACWIGAALNAVKSVGAHDTPSA